MKVWLTLQSYTQKRTKCKRYNEGVVNVVKLLQKRTKCKRYNEGVVWLTNRKATHRKEPNVKDIMKVWLTKATW